MERGRRARDLRAANDINERQGILASSFVTSATIGARAPPRNQARHPRIICHGTSNNSGNPPDSLRSAGGCWLKPAIIGGHLSAKEHARESRRAEERKDPFVRRESAREVQFARRCSTFESPRCTTKPGRKREGRARGKQETGKVGEL